MRLRIMFFLVFPTEMDEPNSVTKALSSPKRDEWLKAMKEELESIKMNKVWDLVDLPENIKLLRTIGFSKLNAN